MSDPDDPWFEPDEDPGYEEHLRQGGPQGPDGRLHPAGPSPGREYVECWRCGRMGFKDLETCIYCRAPLVRGASPSPRWSGRGREAGAGAPGLVKVVLIFIGLLITLLVFFAVQQQTGAGAFDHATVKRRVNQLLVFSIIDGILILLAWAWVGRPPALPRQSVTVRAAAWAVAAPVLLLALALNYAYTHTLRDWLNVPLIEPEFVHFKDLLLPVILVMCVFPAFFEELFFRYLALNTLRGVTGTQGAVLVSSVMFGMAHIGNPLGIPLLMVIGLVLGYMRVASGSLVLPMLMHFGHNLAVLFMK